LKLSGQLPAGKRIKCPKCARLFPVPAEDEEEAPPSVAKRATARQAEEESPRKRRRQEEDFDEDDQDDEEKLEDRAARRRPARRSHRDEDDELEERSSRRPSSRAQERDEEGEVEEEEERKPRHRKDKKSKPRRASLAMRISALVLALIGALFSGGLGTLWLISANSPDVKALRELAGAIADDAEASKLKEAEVKELRAGLARFDRAVKSSYFLLAAVPLGLAGGVLALLGRVKLGGAIMLAAVPIPAVLCLVTLLPLYFLLFGGIVALLTPAWPPDGGPSTGAMAGMTTGGWVLVIAGWVGLTVALPRAVPELKRPSAADGGRLADSGGRKPSKGRLVTLDLGTQSYAEVSRRGIKVGQKIKVKGYINGSNVTRLGRVRLYEGPEPAVSAVEFSRAGPTEVMNLQSKFHAPNDSAILVEGVVVEMNSTWGWITLDGGKD
jgi:hypothetical protein